MKINRHGWHRVGLPLAVVAGLSPGVAAEAAAFQCERTITAQVVALDQAFYNNRLGAFQAGGMIFALKRDVLSQPGGQSCASAACEAGKVGLRPDKRARPIALRMNVGDCMQVRFTNLLAPQQKVALDGGAPFPVPALSQAPSPQPQPGNPGPIQPATRLAGLHVAGMQFVAAASAATPPGLPRKPIDASGSWVGSNDAFNPGNSDVFSGVVAPGASIDYTFYAGAEGTYLLYSPGATNGQGIGEDAFGGHLSQGLFGSVNVQPRGAEWYRSQVTKVQLDLVTRGTTPLGQPVIDYDTVDANGIPILNMLSARNEIVHSDQTAVITGPKHGRFVPCAGVGSTCDQDGYVDDAVFDKNPAYPDRLQPYREFTVIYHDDFESVQSFPAFRGRGPHGSMKYTLQAGRDFFAINYGLGGIGAPIWANRLGLGPMHGCTTCAYEEFFLSSWPNGDPAMIVDFPANMPMNPVRGESLDNAKFAPGPKATKALFPDDPSNVYHSYLGDHAKFRVLHGGTNITHVHHQHAHQWLHSPNSDESHYRDSQMISPGAAYTLDYVYRGSGNKNLTAGDSIFHCHFYPHFAQGMWALWRVHDSFEPGTALDREGRPLHGPKVWNRALPDGEIAEGAPTPAVIPLPTRPMAPMPARVRLVQADSPALGGGAVGYRVEVHPDDLNKGVNPGFPFWIPGVAGQRVPHPPMDFARRDNEILDGGLPRHLVVDGKGLYEKHNRWDFTKSYGELVAYELPENGTKVEQIAMRRHADRVFKSFLPSGNQSPEPFLFNGQKPVAGAPYADPGVRLDGCPVVNTPAGAKADSGELCVNAPGPINENLRHYRGADVELDVVLSKKGWHYPQQRISSLWGDVNDLYNNKRKPQPLFFRVNSGEVVEYWLANLVPSTYALDDFQVRTPTDVLGQHIHLVKFDVLSSDGAANGYNYEDGTFAAQEVRHLIRAINSHAGLYAGPDGGVQKRLKPKCIKELGAAPNVPCDGARPGAPWWGAQATVQRWYADPLLNNKGEDRTIRTVFTHDHFGPSTHQQAGLYAGLVVEPKGSDWFDPETGKAMGGASHPRGMRSDGGPTSWVADIHTDRDLTPWQDSYREFLLEFQDRALMYKRLSRETPATYAKYAGNDTSAPPAFGWSDYSNAIKPPVVPNATGPNGKPWPPPFPQLVTNTFQVGGYSVNYRNESASARVFELQGASLATPENMDLSHVFRSIPRADPALNCQPSGAIKALHGCPGPGTGLFKFPPPFTGAGSFDPYTPLMRVYPGDDVQIRVLVGAHMSAHSMTLHGGLRWLFEPSLENSGFRSTQGLGISEHYELAFKVPYTGKTHSEVADYLYIPSSSGVGLEFGNWGLMRSYQTPQKNLKALPQNPEPGGEASTCPGKPTRSFDIVARQARGLLREATGAERPLVYNARGRPGTPGQQQIVDWNALLYVHVEDLVDPTDPLNSTLRTDIRVEPLILRAAAGDCIRVNLTNGLPDGPLTLPAPAIFNANTRNADNIRLLPSNEIGLHPQLVSLDVTTSNGVNIGMNAPTTLRPGQSGRFEWYAGIAEPDGKSGTSHTPVEFGSVSLSPSDPLRQHPLGLIGALIVEPAGSQWCRDSNSRASARVYTDGKPIPCEKRDGAPAFREFVAVLQDDVSNLRLSPYGVDGPGTREASTAIPASLRPGLFTRGVNYRTEPFPYRYADSDWFDNSRTINNQPSTSGAANKQPKGIARALHNSLVLADPQTPVFAAEAGVPVRMRWVHPAGNAEQSIALSGHVFQEEPYQNASTVLGSNPDSQWFGDRDGFGPNNQFDMLLSQAGGVAGTTGDYLYRSLIGTEHLAGIWGLMRVGEPKRDIVTITSLDGLDGGFRMTGVNTVNPRTGQMGKAVVLLSPANQRLATAEVDPVTGEWTMEWKAPGPRVSAPLVVVSTQGGGRTEVPGEIERILNLTAKPAAPADSPSAPESGARAVDDHSADDVSRFQFQPLKE